ncbi:MAG: ATP-binding protein [Clostridiales bacterium]|jgi:DNA replication protein DnaC|nr:ATP-binding protein [Clostridiales bacterium]
MTNSIYAEIMREYERDRDFAKKKSEQARRDAYRNCPKLEEIDGEIAKTGLAIARLALSRDSAAQLSKTRKSHTVLTEQRAALLKSLGVSGFAPKYKCALCGDTGFVNNKRCDCLKRRLSEKFYNVSNLGAILSKENFSTFDLDVYSLVVDKDRGISPRDNMRAILETCGKFCDAFGKTAQNILFLGDTGLGKTFLCNCIAKDLLDNGRSVLYNTAPRLFKAIENIRFNRQSSADDVMPQMLNEVDLLIIDDLGAEISTVVTNSELFNILNSRLLDNKATIISTNLDLNKLRATYSERITSRLIGYYDGMRFFGKDIRQMRKYKTANAV